MNGHINEASWIGEALPCREVGCSCLPSPELLRRQCGSSMECCRLGLWYLTLDFKTQSLSCTDPSPKANTAEWSRCGEVWRGGRRTAKVVVRALVVANYEEVCLCTRGGGAGISSSAAAVWAV